jgi:hypothetical protein
MTKVVPGWQDKLGRALMLVACVGALIAFAKGVGDVRVASDATLWVEIWRMFGFLVFAGMFALLGFRPRLSPGIWELVFFHKAAMAAAATRLADLPEVSLAGPVDAALVLFIVAAYALTRGWRSWKVRIPFNANA